MPFILVSHKTSSIFPFIRSKFVSYFCFICRRPVLKVVPIYTISTSGLGKIRVKYTLLNLNSALLYVLVLAFLVTMCLYCRMKLGLQPSRQLNSMPSLGVVQSNIGNSKVMNLTNSCRTSSLALYLWRVVSPLGSKSLKRRSLKHGCIFAEGRELFGLKRYVRFTPLTAHHLQFQLNNCRCCLLSGSLCPVIIKP